ncbi:MAG TPA: glycosyltransferase family 1 protein [Stellaceae bacterium]|jgi:glycosyltransferase involved in cell wall biosynthesis
MAAFGHAVEPGFSAMPVLAENAATAVTAAPAGVRAETPVGDIQRVRPALSRSSDVSPNGPPIVLDVSRLLSRAGRETPTGIDRVELAYAQHLIASDAPLSFAASDAAGRLGLLPRQAAGRYIAALAAGWRGDGASPSPGLRQKQLALRLRLGLFVGGRHALRSRLGAGAEPPVYLLVSHYRLESRRALARLKGCGGTRLVCLVHDLIPIEFPEYAKPGQDRRHRQRIETAAALGDAIIAGSSAVGDAFRPYLKRAGRAPPVLVAPFGWQLPASAPGARPDRAENCAPPYFVCVGTIEARKNHLLLLNLWRRLAAELGPSAPRLVLAGQRGWLTQNVIDMLERCPALRGLVIERNTLPDAEMARLLCGARALLLPSFAEGFGFPVIEALALGVPVLCSDLSALRETGGAVPDYLDPLDGSGWRAAILDYAAPQSPRREAQLRRLTGWRPARWEDHFAAVRRLLAQLTGSVGAGPPAERHPPRGS